MNFSQAVQAVIDTTKRPDKQVETERAVNAALSFFVIKAEFPQDLVESTLAISPTEYSGSISIATLVRFRRFKYVQPKNVRKYLTEVGVDQVFTPGSGVQTNVYYVAGTTLNYVLAALNESGILNVGYYQSPPTLTGTDTHWLLDTIPEAVVDRAASRIFQLIGDEASMSSHAGFAKEVYDTLVRDLSQS